MDADRFAGMRFGHSFTIGMSFGVTSAVITTLGLMVGLHSGTHSRLAVLGGILTIAIADAFSDAMGIHMSEESEGVHAQREIWISTASTFIFKLVFGLSFAIPVILLDLSWAVIANVIWGLSLICALSYKFARGRGESFLKVAGEHLLVAIVVILTAHLIGDAIAATFA